ncbi:MAG: hypothetical protein GXX96_10880 [Planctomycetaceae bacterium]|nr:hypothetical protein [Planctomycetaceae bacterium]
MNITTPRHNALNLLADHPERFADQGAVVATWRTYRGRRLGPYYRLTWRENRRQHSVYLGADGPLVDEVRRLLHQTHTARRLKREHRRNRQLFRENVIRPLEQYVKEMFRLFGNGLYLKGSEVRGSRTAGPRLTDADVPPHLIPEFPLPLPAPPCPNSPAGPGQPEPPQRTARCLPRQRPIFGISSICYPKTHRPDPCSTATNPAAG